MAPVSQELEPPTNPGRFTGHFTDPPYNVAIELERYARWTADYQRRLKEDPNAKFGPPDGEAWPPDPNAEVKFVHFPFK